ncbi:MAG: hypothetical protein SOZ45_03295 [Ruminococcus sp.]|nr:hypothetical protein [Ruminococcus sp.]
MNESTKTNNFLNAIQRYADRQKQDMENEIERFRAEEMKKAEEEGLQDAYVLIHKEMDAKKASVTRDLAKKEKQSQDELFVKRNHMMRTVFEKALAKLNAYTSTDEYKEKLVEQTKKIAKMFDGKDCIIYLSDKDLRFSDTLKACFTGDTSVEADPEIKIGGIKVFCPEEGVIADETLDSKLENQKEWFIENSNLKVM